MRHLSPLALALLLCSPAYAQVRVVTEVALPSAPAVAPTSGFAPALTMPSLGATLSVPSLAVSPLFAAPTPVAAQTPVLAQNALIQTATALSVAAKENKDQGAVSRQTFDAGAKTPAASDAVAGSENSSYVRLNPPHVTITPAKRTPVKTAVLETAEVSAMTIPFAFAALIMNGNIASPAFLIPSMLALWALGAWTMRDHLARLRATVVDGWQASHDQKYRIDTATGKLRDIRGHKYGEDRYDKYAPGPVGPLATGLISTAAALAALAFLLL